MESLSFFFIVKMREMEYPNRHKSHVLESASERYVKYHMPNEWIFSKPSNDYGIDLICEIVIDNKIKGYEYGIQLKSKKTDKNTDFVLVKGLKRKSINYWLNSLKPIMLIVYVEEQNQAYWKWITNSTFDLKKANSKFQLKIDKKNTISQINVDKISNYIKDYYLEVLKLKNLPDFEKDYGWQLYLEGQYEKALPYLKKMSKSIDVLNAISTCYYTDFQYKKSLIFINESLDKDPENPTLLSNKASILIEMGNMEKDVNLIKEGLKIINSLTKNKKLSSNTYFNYGVGLMSLKFYEKAKEVFKSVLNTNPNKAEAWKNLGTTYHNLHLFRKEIECYDKSLSINPNLIEALNSKGITLHRVFKNHNEALDLFMRVIEIDIQKTYQLQYPYVDFYIAECYYSLGDIEKAKQWNNIGLKNNPTDKYFLSQKQLLLDY